MCGFLYGSCPIQMLLLIWIVSYTNAASSFQPECTLPPAETRYVSGPNTRGTTSILFNCLSIIFLCTWNIQHLNIPADTRRIKVKKQPVEQPTSDGIMVNIWWKWKSLAGIQRIDWAVHSIAQSIWFAFLDTKTKIKWMTITMLIPEYLMGKALSERLAANVGVKVMNNTAFGDHGRGQVRETVTKVLAHRQYEWEKIHVYMANMGYFVVNFDEPRKRDRRAASQETFESLPKRFRDQEDITGRSGRVPSLEVNLRRLKHGTWALNNSQLRLAMASDIIDLPDVSGQALAKQDRGDKLAKFLAIIQITYLVMQLSIRKLKNLPSTQLEIAALAFSVSSLIAYIMYWSRPQNVNGVHLITAKRIPTNYEFQRILLTGQKYMWTYRRGQGAIDCELDFAAIPNDGTNAFLFRNANPFLRWISKTVGENEEVIPIAFGAIFGGMLFGGLHLLAWDFHFPSRGEQLAWRISSIITACLPVFSIVPFVFWQQLESDVPRFTRAGERAGYFPHNLSYKQQIFRRIFISALLLILSIYFLARLFLMVEIFRSLFYLPPDAYRETWSGSSPHFSG